MVSSFFPYQLRPLPLAVFPTVAEEHSLQLTQGDGSVIDGVESPCQWESIRSPHKEPQGLLGTQEMS